MSVQQRRMSAIVVTDVVGYSRMMGEDEQGTLDALKEALQSTILPEIAAQDGHLVKSLGDGQLIEFASLHAALSCCRSIQTKLEEDAEGIDPERQLRMRIGIHLGEVISDGGDIFGDSVNVAARLQEVAGAGGIAISQSAYDQLDARQISDFVGGKALRLKNIRKATTVWHWPEIPEDITSKLADESSTPPTIAVLPFKNISGDPDQEYFADGLTEDLITAISYWGQFPVIARNSSFAFKGKSLKTDEIARELGARYLLEGSVRSAGKRMRITATLVDASTGHERWVEKFDRLLEDIFDVQDEITTRVASVVGHQITQAELSRLARDRRHGFSAWDLLVQGIPHFLSHSCEGNRKARDFFLQAIDQSEDYCDAWAYLAWSYSHDLMLRCDVDREETKKLGFEAGQKAVSLNDNSALAHLALGSLYVWTGDGPNGLREAQRALELNPNDVRAAFAVGNRLTLTGAFEEGVEIIERALKLNPSDPYRWHYFGYLSRAYLSLKAPETALTWADKANQLRPEQAETHFRLALCRAHLGQIDKARGDLARIDELDATFIASKRNWKPYPDEELNDQLLAPMRDNGLI